VKNEFSQARKKSPKTGYIGVKGNEANKKENNTASANTSSHPVFQKETVR
jgi:hypothetical protein